MASQIYAQGTNESTVLPDISMDGVELSLEVLAFESVVKTAEPRLARPPNKEVNCRRRSGLIRLERRRFAPDSSSRRSEMS